MRHQRVIELLSLISLLPFGGCQSANVTQPKWIAYNTDVAYYPYEVHLPDRTTRNLPPLSGPPPLLFSLSGSGARGNASDGAVLAGYDGASRKIRQYDAGNTTYPPMQLAAEEFLTVVPIAPIDSSQADANWNDTDLPAILAQVVSTYSVDLTRIYFSAYSMGSRAAWSLAMNNPNLWAGMIISSGSTAASPEQLGALLGIPIRNYYGTEDEDGLDVLDQTTQANYQQALLNPPPGVDVSTGSLETIVVPNATHLEMTDRPWDRDIIVDGYPGALSWLLQQKRATPATIPSQYAKKLPPTSSTSTSRSAAAAVSTSKNSGTSSLKRLSWLGAPFLAAVVWL